MLSARVILQTHYKTDSLVVSLTTFANAAHRFVLHQENDDDPSKMRRVLEKRPRSTVSQLRKKKGSKTDGKSAHTARPIIYKIAPTSSEKVALPAEKPLEFHISCRKQCSYAGK